MKQLFTKQERYVVLFLIAGILIGAAVRLLNPNIRIADTSADHVSTFEKIVKQMDSSHVHAGENLNSASRGKAAEDFKIDLNRATIDDLIALPKIGPALAKRIIEYRKVHGKFQDISQLINVKGVGKKTLEKLKPFIFVTPDEQ